MNKKYVDNRYDNNFDVEMTNNLDNNGNSLIKVDPTKTVGIDLNNFNNPMDDTIHSISQANDLPIIQEIMDQHQSFKGILGKRMNSLRMIANSWSKGDRDGAFTAVTM